jgi:hypothetical protein
MRVRSLIPLGLLLAGLTLNALAQKDPDKTKVYKTPQECHAAGVEAFHKKDHKTWVGCLAPQAQKALASELAVDFASDRAGYAKLEEKEREAVVKALEPVYDVMDRHGLTQKATKDVTKSKDAREQEKARKAVLELIKNPETFLVDLYAALDKLEGKPKEQPRPREKLTDVKIDGDKATATIVTTTGKGKKETQNKEPVKFEKINGSWRMIPDFKPPEAPKDKDKKDKDEKKD